ncbi:glycosyltransferase [Mycobacterium sp. 852002-53434_SCH5985345]|uniref:glycosyltransferase n=1 Tax=unclassified Mycobacterium TaxID=2642494 RepID=UPI0007FED10D|nr:MULTISPECIES: glycosyltransferase [unclassified Mycobacterium]OBF50936.1 glycosyltransferase [Mycobacterium sp. 852002-53434_SCH5985345]OBF78420.1 glycosyltransferase [Mycobacterium sp. 852002-51613_SCH5001154]OBF97655.1 glycosyltransferase [Mycobacterium sp. 852014-52450_SCH5900713]
MKFVLASYGGRGDIEPCAALGRELSRRGHDVRLAVPPDKVGFVESAGLPAVAYGPDTQRSMNAASEFLGRFQNGLGALSQATERVSRIWAEKSATLTSLAKEADLLLAHMNDQALAANVAEYHGIPLAALHVFPARIMPSSELYSGITREAGAAQRRALGLPEVAASAGHEDGSLELQTYDEICLPGPAAEWVEPGGRRPFVGSLTLELPTDADDDVLSWIAAGTPPIYFGFGSTPIDSPAETVAVISAACARLGERALICAGANDFGGVPRFDHVKVVDALNYAAVFPACRAVVHHGGSGTTAAGLRAGVPTLILWTVWDQPMWAEAVDRLKLGAGRRFLDSTLDSLVADLRSILTPECAARAREVAAQMSKPAESVAKAADLLEDAARSD